MRTIRVASKNADYQKFEVLKTNRNKRHKYGEFFVEGVRNLNQAVENGWEIVSFLYTREKPLSRWAQDMLGRVQRERDFQLSAPLMEELSGKEDASELMAVVKQKPDDLSRLGAAKEPLYVLFDRPSNRGNLGTILRSCDALGVDGVLLTGHGVDLYDPEVVTASMGSFFRVPAVRVPDNETVFRFLEEMKGRYPGFRAIGTTAHRQHVLYREDLSGPLLFFIGNETDGLCYAFKEKSDLLCTIPMVEESSASSFNVACAATVLLYEAARQRAIGGENP